MLAPNHGQNSCRGVPLRSASVITLMPLVSTRNGRLLSTCGLAVLPVATMGHTMDPGTGRINQRAEIEFGAAGRSPRATRTSGPPCQDGGDASHRLRRRLRRRAHRLVRRVRPRPAVATSGHLAVGGAGQRGDAAADPGGPGAAGLPQLAGALAGPGGAGRRLPRRGGADVGQARLPAPGAAAARLRVGDRGPARRPGTGGARRAAGAARGRRVHRAGGAGLRVRHPGRGGGHQCAPGAGPGDRRPGPARHRRPPAGTWRP